MVLRIVPDRDAFVCVNSMFFGFVRCGEAVCLPPTGNETSISVFANNCLPAWCLVDGESVPHLSVGDGRLNVFAEYCELEVFCDEISSPPIVSGEKRWGNDFAGLCAKFFVLQTSVRTLYFPARGVLSFEILSEQFACLHFADRTVIVDRLLKERLSLPACSVTVSQNRLCVLISENMEFYKVERIYDLTSLALVSSRAISAAPKTDFETIRCFCESVRFSLKEQAESFLTDSLKSSLPFESICSFLGTFDFCKKAEDERRIFLRYPIDEKNFNYICYEFKLVRSTDCVLIDDVYEI